ncbi:MULTISPECIES: hypothetical protein [unclassified Candidatus Frackibacter]|uniref:hypothetical protein n=1 Tax=unclassified Candidatus Frackibacter TaxID=2648818 RepID=UPI000883B8E9|nr:MULTISPECIES: hypothetical protein [unclassified Candidatus Frackibacter]SDC50911.1 hypothetical protein SAMN04515661_11230 [Candidatus Frackibacter sp. WG11]SEM40580.1 hypothetical protein SAMN04488698_10329 [Candidatus Frackibacter sp. WG12]SFL75006.1 hypothetical protein SAMN04488699_11227 [Candidatus Frackibacter sp. WG13]
MEPVAKKYSNQSESMELIISILIRYPQINKVNIDPENKELSFTFLVDSKLEKNRIEQFTTKLKKSLELFNRLAKIEPSHLKVDFDDYEVLTKVKVITSLLSLTKDKLSFFIQFFQSEFSNDLLVESIEPLPEDALTEQEETINSLLIKLDHKRMQQSLTGFRDGDKVLVFDKAIKSVS